MPPASLLIKPVSGLCNMRCEYCFYNDVVKHRKTESCGVMSINSLEILVRKALDYAQGACHFIFQGGEPTLAGIDYFKALIRLQRKYNQKNVRIHNSLQTNGYNLGDEWADFFAENNFLIGISLDGTRATHNMFRKDSNGNGSFESVARSIKLLNKYNVEFNILCVVNNVVASAANDVYTALKKYKYIQFIPCLDGFGAMDMIGSDLSSFSLTSEKYAIFLKKVFDRYYNDAMSGNYVSIRNFDNYVNLVAGRPASQCGMNGICTCYFLIEADGSVYPCDFYVLDKWLMGNFHKDSFARMAKSDAVALFIESSKHVSPECASCRWKALCNGGCRRYREPFIDNKPSLNIHCSALKEFFSYSHDRMLKLAENLCA